jgi:hypothetical protein
VHLISCWWAFSEKTKKILFSSDVYFVSGRLVTSNTGRRDLLLLPTASSLSVPHLCTGYTSFTFAVTWYRFVLISVSDNI